MNNKNKNNVLLSCTHKMRYIPLTMHPIYYGIHNANIILFFVKNRLIMHFNRICKANKRKLNNRYIVDIAA